MLSKMLDGILRFNLMIFFGIPRFAVLSLSIIGAKVRFRVVVPTERCKKIVVH